MNRVFQKKFKEDKVQLDKFIYDFNVSGKQFGKADRNTIKLFELGKTTINIKSFRVPNIFNQIAYKFFRKSKAQRSFEYAIKLIDLKIGTPQPIAFYEFSTLFMFKKSFYISEHLDCDLTYRDLTTNFDYPNYDDILRAFTRFTYELHEKGIHFLDHSPGNTLIKKVDNGYDFFLVDLNRMKFKPLKFKTRIKNFSRLTIHKSMIEIMSDEYAKCSGYDYETVFSLMWKTTQDFQHWFQVKKRLKKKLKFWKK